MKDIESQLAELGRRTRNDIGVPGLSAAVVDRARSRRRLAMISATLSVAIVVTGVAYGVTNLRVGDATPPIGSDPTPQQESRVTVPDVIGLRIRHATVALRNAGFDVRVEENSTSRSAGVSDQDPPPGQLASRGTIVTITTTTSEQPDEAFALWPEDTRAAAEAACNQLEASGASWRREQKTVASEFARQVLSWPQSHVELTPQDGAYIRKTPHTPETTMHNRVWLWMSDLYPPDEPGNAPSCWSVVSVGRPPDKRPSGWISVRGRSFSIGFDPQGAAEIRGELYYNERGTNLRWVGGDTIFRGNLGTRPQTSGHFLLLFLDEDGDVFSASGGPLPEGDFATG